MKPKEFTVTISHTVQPEKYNSLKVEVSTTYEKGSVDEALEEVEKQVVASIQKQVKRWSKRYPKPEEA